MIFGGLAGIAPAMIIGIIAGILITLVPAVGNRRCPGYYQYAVRDSADISGICPSGGGLATHRQFSPPNPSKYPLVLVASRKALKRYPRQMEQLVEVPTTEGEKSP
jgi:hypothetical protein